MSECLRYLIADRLVRVRELPWANKYMHQLSLIKLPVHIENLHRVTKLNYNPYRYCKIPLNHYLGHRSWLFLINSSGYWHQQVKRVLSCVCLQIPSHTSLLEYGGNEKNHDFYRVRIFLTILKERGEKFNGKIPFSERNAHSKLN